MFRSLLTASLLVAFGSAAASAEGTFYRDPQGRFTLTVPSGWSSQKPEQESLVALYMVSPKNEKNKDAGGICLVLVSETPQTREMKQSELDDAFAQVMTPDFWKRSFEAGGVKDVVVEDAGNKVHKGRKAYYLVATASSTAEDGKVSAVTSKQMIHPVPGDLFFVQCTATKAGFVAMKPVFEKVFASFEPRVNETLVYAPQSAPSVLTLFSGPGFDGVAHTIAQNTANIPALTGRAISTGISIAGYGQWEVCEDVNFGGFCRVVAATHAVQPGQVLKVGSVRRYAAEPSNARNAAGVVSASSTFVFKSGIEKFRAH
jgi:hypothetical protein